LAVGPWMPEVVSTGRAQNWFTWVPRVLMFAGAGGLSGWLAHGLRQAREAAGRAVEATGMFRAMDLAVLEGVGMEGSAHLMAEMFRHGMRASKAIFWAWDADQQVLRAVATVGFPVERRSAFAFLRLKSGEACTGLAFAEKKTVVYQGGVKRSALRAAGAPAPYLEELKDGTVVSAPLVSDGHCLGTLDAIYAEPHALSPAERGWLDAFARDAARAFAHISNSQSPAAAMERALALVAEALELREGRATLHEARVAELASRLARAFDLPHHDAEALRRAAILHDVGKITVPEDILLKPGPLTSDEWEIIRKHSDEGATFVARECADIIRYHHERWDGTGYPSGLSGAGIPLLARILGVVDAYDAMTTPRPYRPALTHEQAVQELRRGAGAQFDPEIVERFLELVHAGEEAT